MAQCTITEVGQVHTSLHKYFTRSCGAECVTGEKGGMSQARARPIEQCFPTSVKNHDGRLANFTQLIFQVSILAK